MTPRRGRSRTTAASATTTAVASAIGSRRRPRCTPGTLAMRIAVLSDIHGNRQAFQAVLEEVDAERVDQVWCLGDGVGYGADPDACCQLARGSCALWLVNPGSVGQPRDGDARAAWLVLDTGAWTATYRRTPYDIAGAASAIRAARLPESLAERLEYGQ